MLEDQTFTRRVTEFKQPGTRLNCHASVYTTYKKLGNGDLAAGFDRLNAMPYVEAENSTGFHAPQEAMRVLTKSIDFSRRGQAGLRKR